MTAAGRMGPERGAPPSAGGCIVRIDGTEVHVPAGVSVAAALEIEGGRGGRRSAGGQRRQAFCGMGVCGECRVTIDGWPHRLGCMTPCLPGMEIHRDD